MKPIILTEEYYGHTLEVTINNVTGEIDFIPDKVKEDIFGFLADNQTEGEFSEEETGGFSGSWRIIELNYEFLRMISLWKYNHSQDEALSEDLFIKYFGVIDGKHFYEKWVYSFKRDLMEMISYFGKETTKGQIFCDMVINQVNKYIQRKK